MTSKYALIGRWIASAMLLLLCSATGSFAESKYIGNIHQGDFYTGGSFSLSYNKSSDFSQTTVSLIPSLQYFVVDRLSVGGDFYVTHTSTDSGSTTLGFGPAATYHFFADDKWSAYVGAGALYNKLSFNSSAFSDVNYFSVSGKLGLNYFFTPSVALGPELYYTHTFNTDTYVGYNQYNLLIGFGIYL
jgi:hypothetical protein